MPYSPFYKEPWDNCFIHPTYDKQPTPFEVNYSWINSYQTSLMDAGTQVGATFSTCTYGNFFEFGWNVSDGGWPASSCSDVSPGDCHEKNRCDADKVRRIPDSSTRVSHPPNYGLLPAQTQTDTITLRCRQILWQNFSSAVIRSYQDDDGHKGMLMPSGCLGSVSTKSGRLDSTLSDDWRCNDIVLNFWWMYHW